MVDGLVTAATEQERLTRNKGTGKFPGASIAFCLRHARIRLADVDRIAFGEQGGDGPLRDPTISAPTILWTLQEEVDASFDDLNRILLVEHHTAHAWSAYAPSGFRECLVVTADGFGDGTSGTVWVGKDGTLSEPLTRIPFTASLGHFYSCALGYFSYDVDDEYKLMGLAPYGDPARYRSAMADTFLLGDGGDYSFDVFDRADWDQFYATLGPRRRPGARFLRHHADVAAVVQETFETILLHLMRSYRERTGLTHLAAAGGCFQNSAAVGMLRRSGLFDQVFVQPAAHDAGIAVGACYAAQRADQCSSSTRGEFGPYLGSPVGQDGEISSELTTFKDLISWHRPEDLYRAVASELSAGLVVGWMQGRSEFGPRALGNRSILADPCYDSMRHRINSAVKSRESFRPLAPVVLEDKAPVFFEVEPGERLPFMTATVGVRPQWRRRLAAVTHVDGSARLQTVNTSQNDRLSSLLREYEQQTGVPVLINTSLNGPGEPIVDSVQDGVEFFLKSGLDMLVIGDHVIRKRATLHHRLAQARYALRADWTVEPASPPEHWHARSAHGDKYVLDAGLAEDWRLLAESGEVASRMDLWPSLSTLWNVGAVRLS